MSKEKKLEDHSFVITKNRKYFLGETMSKRILTIMDFEPCGYVSLGQESFDEIQNTKELIKRGIKVTISLNGKCLKYPQNIQVFN